MRFNSLITPSPCLVLSHAPQSSIMYEIARAFFISEGAKSGALPEPETNLDCSKLQYAKFELTDSNSFPSEKR